MRADAGLFVGVRPVALESRGFELINKFIVGRPRRVGLELLAVQNFFRAGKRGNHAAHGPAINIQRRQNLAHQVMQTNAVSGHESALEQLARRAESEDRKSTRLNSSHPSIPYAVFGLKK